MNGAECILSTLQENGVDTVFTNPGTSEMQLVAALDVVEGVRPILGLFEGVCTGAADGYGRIAGKPAATLLHLGPGLANGLANLHNAKRAGTPIVNLVGDHAVAHLSLDAPLTSDIAGLAAPMSHTVATLQDKDTVGKDTAEAIHSAYRNGGEVSTLIVPADMAWSDTSSSVDLMGQAHKESAPDPAQFAAAIHALRTSPESTMLLLAGSALTDDGLILAERLKTATGCRTATPTFTRRHPRGGGRPSLERVPYLSEMAVPFFEAAKTVILIDAPAPVAFFAYPEKASTLTTDDCTLITLAGGPVNGTSTLERLVAELDAPALGENNWEQVSLACPEGELNAESVAKSLSRHMPEDAIIVDEAITSGMFLLPLTESAPKHDWLFLTGGSIGQGLPVATGAAVAAPNRKVINFEGDGSALYTIQALWTQAREHLDVVTVIFNNQAYQVLQYEMMRTGSAEISGRAMSTLRIDDPTMSFTSMAESFGVPSERVETAEAFDQVFEKAMSRTGPFLIEAMM